MKKSSDCAKCNDCTIGVNKARIDKKPIELKTFILILIIYANESRQALTLGLLLVT